MEERTSQPDTQIRLEQVLRGWSQEVLTYKHMPLSIETILEQCSACITICSHLNNLHYKDIKLALTLITTCESALKSVINDSPLHQNKATKLISQALQVRVTPGFHLQGMETALTYGEQAVSYARQSGDTTRLVTALRGLSADYEIGITDHPERGKKAYELTEEAISLIDQDQASVVPTFIQSWVYSGRAKYQALYGMKREMEATLAKAEETFFASPEQENSPDHIDYSLAHLLRHKAIAYAFLGDQSRAYTIFTSKLFSPGNTSIHALLPMPPRVRIGTLSEFLFTTLYLPHAQKDQELSIALLQLNIQEAKALGSAAYMREARAAYGLMSGVWPDDSRVKDLRDLL